MTASLPLAAALKVGQPLFGNQWLALLAALACIALLLGLVALLGRWLAATHPAPPPTTPRVKVDTVSIARAVTEATAATPVLVGEVAPEIVPVIIAAVAACLGVNCRVSSIQRVATPVTAAPSLEALMQQWSYEGRRQIYSSHKVR